MRILYFAWLRRQIGKASEDIVLPATVTTLGDLVTHLRSLSEGHAAALEDLEGLRAAIDQEFAEFDAPILGAREIALFPPVTGG
ncbi:molybdopterin converting factor subunit 1 [Lacibacterium aquatile]|uniref:Molybdopterin converting factor subunit 1 n=1 Tax=Lacibacterium aquatile TaxID=1168082 RepID=A0ABW5DTN7_9PROT